jgi:di/tricarboxylate transporter
MRGRVVTPFVGGPGAVLSGVYQTNTYVYGVAGYRFADFTRAGLPLNALYSVVSVFLIPRLWPF